MYIADGIAYAGEPVPTIKVSGVRALEGKRLWVRFTTGEAKIFDCTPLLAMPAFAPLADEAVFQGVYIDYGVAVWQDGKIDIAPELLYQDGIAASVAATA